MRRTFFARYSFVILLAVCFFTPLVLRGARDALRQMKNDVKDWLPSHFQETGDIQWFWRHFQGERFIIVTWDGCRGDASDEAFHLFKRKLAPAIPPSKQGEDFPPPPSKDVGSTWLERPFRFIGDDLGLYALSNDHFNWGGLKEKWMRGDGGKWYYVLPNGDLYAFEGQEGPLPALFRGIWHRLGFYELKGKHLARFGPVDGPWYYKNPSRLSAQFFRSVVTGPDVLNELTQQNASGVSMMEENEARAKLNGVLFGPDGKQTAMVVTVTEAGLRDFHRVLSRGVLGKERGLLYKIADECGIPPNELRLGGPPVDNVAIDEEGNITLVRLVSLVIVFCLTLAYFSFRSVMATGILFFTGGIGAALGMAIVGWSGTSADAVMMSMPALVYVLGISGAVHLINYYREAVDEHGLVGAPERALSHGWKPALLCNVTTGFGLLSLYSAEVVPIRKFGLFAAAGVMGTLILLFTFVPAALQMWPLNLPKKKVRADGAESWLDAYLSNYWERFGRFIIRNYIAVCAVCTLMIALVGYGVTRINTSVNLLELFDGDAKILTDYRWIEQRLGKLIPMEVVVKFAPESIRQPADEDGEQPADVLNDRARLSPVDRVEVVARIQEYVAKYLGETPHGAGVVGQSMSAITFTPKLPGATEFATRRAFDSRLAAERDQLLKSDFFNVDLDDGSELWRISLRVAAFMGIDYGDFVVDLRSVVEPVIVAYNVRHRIIEDAVKLQAEQEAAGNSAARIQIALVMPDELAKKAFPPRAPKRRARKTDDAAEAAPHAEQQQVADGEAADEAAEEEVKKFEGVEIDHDLIFTQTLYSSLRAANIFTRPILESKLDDKALEGMSCVVLLGDLQPAATAIAQASQSQLIDGRQVVDDVLAASVSHVESNLPGTPHRQVSAVYTGVVPIVYKAQRTLLSSLIDSTIWSFLTITPLMILVSRSLGAGLVAMLPNALPVLVIFGAMGWMGVRVDIGSMMTASIALGVAVDDTIHYLTWFREELNRLGDRKLAILGAYRRCATPTFQAATISGLGLSIFAFSTFTPTQRFGYLMLAILFAGVFAELVFFPALLASPLGLVFRPKKSSHDTPADGSGGSGEQDGETPATVRIEAARDASKRIASL